MTNHCLRQLHYIYCGTDYLQVAVLSILVFLVMFDWVSCGVFGAVSKCLTFTGLVLITCLSFQALACSPSDKEQNSKTSGAVLVISVTLFGANFGSDFVFNILTQRTLHSTLEFFGPLSWYRISLFSVDSCAHINPLARKVGLTDNLHCLLTIFPFSQEAPDH